MELKLWLLKKGGLIMSYYTDLDNDIGSSEESEELLKNNKRI